MFNNKKIKEERNKISKSLHNNLSKNGKVRD